MKEFYEVSRAIFFSDMLAHALHFVGELAFRTTAHDSVTIPLPSVVQASTRSSGHGPGNLRDLDDVTIMGALLRVFVGDLVLHDPFIGDVAMCGAIDMASSTMLVTACEIEGGHGE